MKQKKNTKLCTALSISCSLIMAATCTTVLAVGSSWHMVNINSTSNLGDANILINDDIVSMVDAGEYETAKHSLMPYLNKLGITSIDHFFVSHPHNDHYTGIDALLEGGILLKNIYYNMPPEGVSDFAYAPSEFVTTLGKAESRGANLQNIGKGFRISLPNNNEIKVLYAHKTRQLDGVNVSVNDYSLIMRWDTDGFRVLFTGDLNYLLGNFLSKYDYLKADILKVPHHGVTAVAPNAFFDTVAPKLNMFPTPQLLWSSPRIEQVKQWTLNKKILYCITGLNGNVALNFNESTMSILPEIETLHCPAGSSNIVPGKRINGPIPLPQLLILLDKN